MCLCVSLCVVPGLVSTEVDARLSFDTGATLKRARKIIKMYEEVSPQFAHSRVSAG